MSNNAVVDCLTRDNCVQRVEAGEPEALGRVALVLDGEISF